MISNRGNQVWGLRERTILSSQGFCKFKTVLKLADYFKNEIVMIAGENQKGKTDKSQREFYEKKAIQMSQN